MADLMSVDLNDPVQNKKFTEMGGWNKYALTSTDLPPIDPETGRSPGPAVSKAIPWTSSGQGFDSLPDAVKDKLVPAWRRVKSGELKMGFNPFETATAYAVDPTTGEVIVRTDNGIYHIGKNDSSTQSSSSSDGSSVSTKPVTSTSTVSTSDTSLDPNKIARQSAYDLLYQQFAQYGLGSLVEPLKDLIQKNVSPSEFTLALRETDAYKKRFAANIQRINKGLRALSEAEYIGLEDQYQNVMRQYGLPVSYYAKGEMGIQPGFEKFIAGDVSPAELEDRVQTAQNRVINAAPEIKTALRQFYPDITNGDILAYALDPQQALTNIKRKVSAAEIGGAALQAGLEATQGKAEQLLGYGVTQQQARQGYQTIGGGLQRGSELASIYSQSPYTQSTAEQEVFGIPGAVEAQTKRKKLIGLERATFGGQTGAGGALQRERAGGY